MIIIIILLILLLLLLLLLLIIIIIKWVKRFHEGEESTIQELNIKHQESETSRITANEDTESKKIVIFKITGISLEFILIYTLTGLLTILGAILLVVCINHYRTKGNRSTKRCVKSALNIPHLFGRVGPYNLYKDISLVLNITVAELRGETTHQNTMGEEICWPNEV